jgi:hypothetical protein
MGVSMKRVISIATASLLVAAGGTVALGASASSAAPTITPKALKVGAKCPKSGKVKTTAKYGKLKCVKKNGTLKWKKVSAKAPTNGFPLYPAPALPSVGSR